MSKGAILLGTGGKRLLRAGGGLALSNGVDNSCCCGGRCRCPQPGASQCDDLGPDVYRAAISGGVSKMRQVTQIGGQWVWGKVSGTMSVAATVTWGAYATRPAHLNAAGNIWLASWPNSVAWEFYEDEAGTTPWGGDPVDLGYDTEVLFVSRRRDYHYCQIDYLLAMSGLGLLEGMILWRGAMVRTDDLCCVAGVLPAATGRIVLVGGQWVPETNMTNVPWTGGNATVVPCLV